MDPNVFRKGDAPSCLVVDKTWDDIIDKPDSLDELASRIVAMIKNAEELGYVLKSTNFGVFKQMINAILLEPLKDGEYDTPSREDGTPGNIRADAFWDEIQITDSTWERFRDAIDRAFAMRVAVSNHRPLTNRDVLQNVKDNFNEAVIAPLRGDFKPEE